jgi:hypothetical protein
MTTGINKGFDRDVDYLPMKNNLINDFHLNYKKYLGKFKKRSGSALIYLLIVMIQLRNGSRISEAITAFKLFIEKGYEEKVIVKIAKSGGIKYIHNKDGAKEQIITKERFRKIMFPVSWIKIDNINNLFNKLKNTHNKVIYKPKIKLSVIHFMLNHYQSNTHSLRYAFINYMLYQEKRPIPDIAKFVGHQGTNQLVTYTQLKNVDQIFDLDI